MSSPRVLYLTTRFPWPLDRGDRIRAYRLVERFSRLAEVTLVTFHDSPATDAPIQHLLPFCKRVEVIHHPASLGISNMLSSVGGSDPFQVAYYRSAAMSTLVDRLAGEQWDVAFAQLFRMLPYLNRLRAGKKVLELSDSLALNLERATRIKPWWSRLPFHEELRRVRQYERVALAAADEAWVVAEPDRQDLLARAPGARIEVIPMGLEERWGPGGLTDSKEPLALFLGNLTVGHNLDTAEHLVRRIWPLVRRQRADARLILVGRAAARARRLDDPGSGVEVAGYVDDLVPLLSRAVLGVAPLRYGAGLQNKVIELMAAGLPSVVTPMVNEGIGARPGVEIVVAASDNDMASAIVTLMNDPEDAARLGRAARAFATSRYRWDLAEARMAGLLGASER